MKCSNVAAIRGEKPTPTTPTEGGGEPEGHPRKTAPIREPYSADSELIDSLEALLSCLQDDLDYLWDCSPSDKMSRGVSLGMLRAAEGLRVSLELYYGGKRLEATHG